MTVNTHSAPLRIAILDDGDLSRRSVTEAVQDAGMVPVQLTTPIADTLELVQKCRAVADALVSDHRMVGYVAFTGAAGVAESYKARVPAVLCTAWSHSAIEEIVAHRRWIPKVVDATHAADPEEFASGIRQCQEEFLGRYSAARQPHKVMVRVEGHDREFVGLIISGWSQEVIRLLKRDMPEAILKRIEAGEERFYAEANKGAEEFRDIYIANFRIR